MAFLGQRCPGSCPGTWSQLAADPVRFQTYSTVSSVLMRLSVSAHFSCNRLTKLNDWSPRCEIFPDWKPVLFWGHFTHLFLCRWCTDRSQLITDIYIYCTQNISCCCVFYFRVLYVLHHLTFKEPLFSFSIINDIIPCFNTFILFFISYLCLTIILYYIVNIKHYIIGISLSSLHIKVIHSKLLC